MLLEPKALKTCLHIMQMLNDQNRESTKLRAASMFRKSTKGFSTYSRGKQGLLNDQHELQAILKLTVSAVPTGVQGLSPIKVGNYTGDYRWEFISIGKQTCWPTDPNKTPDLMDFFILKITSSNYIKIEEVLELISGHSPIYLIINISTEYFYDCHSRSCVEKHTYHQKKAKSA